MKFKTRFKAKAFCSKVLAGAMIAAAISACTSDPTVDESKLKGSAASLPVRLIGGTTPCVTTQLITQLWHSDTIYVITIFTPQLNIAGPVPPAYTSPLLTTGVNANLINPFFNINATTAGATTYFQGARRAADDTGWDLRWLNFDPQNTPYN